ncbi:MAG: hypothetical protein CM15mP120_06460 [Pseudomonadota bacterium]|nr:MAG: hypothetical protein CM15mP120_06460 [Pseudomonadota bacterium]
MCWASGCGAGAWRPSAIKRGTADNQRIHNGRRITSAAQMRQITSLYGALRADLEAFFSPGAEYAATQCGN